jgi:predicted nucleic acid-binding protein
VTCIVADSGPLIMFGRSDLLGLLRAVAGEIMVPVTVFTECTRDATKPGVSDLIDAARSGVIAVMPETAPISQLSSIANLDAGEIMALTMARHLGCPVLMDETIGRKAAARLTIPVIGSAGILLAAKERGLIAEIAPILARWKGWGYFLAPALLDAVLSRAGEAMNKSG